MFRLAPLFLLFGMACAKIPVAPLRMIDFEFVLQERDGTPIGGAVVIFRRTTSRYPTYVGETNSSGKAGLELPEGHLYGAALIYGHLPLPFEVEIPEFKVSETSASHAYRIPGVYVSGEIIGPEGSALDGGYVAIQGAPTSGDYEVIDFSYAGPTFRALVAPGMYRVTASGRSPSPYVAAVIDSLPIVNDTTLTFQLVGTRVEGRVTGRGGAPLPGARVDASSTTATATGRADAAGDYWLYVPPGSYRWTVSPPDTMPYVLKRYEPTTIISGPATKDLSLDGALWSGTLRSDDSGEPLAGWYVRAVPWGSSGRSATCRTTYTGGFQLVLERGLEYDIVVETLYGYSTRLYRPGIANADSTLALTATDPYSSNVSRR